MSWLKRLVRHVRVRPRLALSTALCAASLVLMPARLGGATRALVAWNLGAGLYVALAWIMMLRSSVEKMRWRARVQDDGALAVLGLTLAAAVASLAAIGFELVSCRNVAPAARTSYLVLSGATILLSWLFVHTAFALHYAHEYYAERGAAGHREGLVFPGSEAPDYADFLYFSFVIGATSQTADVDVASRTMRRLALLHGVVAFLFNTTLLALTVNIAASLI